MTAVRKARMQDVPTIRSLIGFYSQRGDVLPKALIEIYEHLRDFFVLTSPDGKEVKGCCALSICWEGLAEIRSLVVHPDLQKRGWGRRLVEACLSEAVTLGVYKVFTLTYQRDFFAKLGFEEVTKEKLPQKVWADCIHCPKFPECDEIAMVMEM